MVQAVGSPSERWGAVGSGGERQTKLHLLARCSPSAVRPGSLQAATGTSLRPGGWGPHPKWPIRSSLLN